MTRLRYAAQKVIENYVFEMAPRFDIRPNWERIWAIERRYDLVGYGEMIEARYRKAVAEQAFSRCQEQYNTRMDSDSFARLQDARAELVAVSG
jgi:hypothetical protein